MSGTACLTSIRLKFVHRFRDRHGKTRHYFRRPGYKRVSLPGLPGSAEFMAAYQAALAGHSAPRIEIGVSRTKPGSVAAAVAAYFGSMAFGNLAADTQRQRRRILEHFREAHGDKSFAKLERRHIESMIADKIAAPHAARNFIKALRGLMASAIAAGLRDDDPTLGIRNVRLRDTGGYRTWTEGDIAQFEARHPIGSRARLAFGLLLYTAQRRGDIIRMGRQHIRDGFILVRQQKTSMSLEIPVLPELQEILAAHPAEHLTFLTTRAGEPFTAAGFTGWFRDRCREAGLPLGLSAHGLRKAALSELAEANCTVHQIAAISGHASLKEVQRYTKAADQKRLAAAAMEARLKNKRGTKLANLRERLANMKRNQLKLKEQTMKLATPAVVEYFLKDQ
jgi:integrase